MLQSMGVVVLEERPFTVTRPDGLPVWIYQFKISQHPDIPTPPAGRTVWRWPQRFADAVTAIWHGRAEIDRFNELVLRAGLTWQQVAVLRTYAKYLRQAGFPYSQVPHRRRCSTATQAPPDLWSSCSRTCSTRSRRTRPGAGTRRPPPPPSQRTSTR